MSLKSKSALSETPNNKASPATPMISKISRRVTKSDADSPSPVPSSRLSIERSPRAVVSKSAADGPRSVNSKPIADRRSPKLSTPPDKQPQTRVSKVSDLQAQLTLLQEDLKKAKDQLELVEKEKVHALDEFKGAQKLAEEASEKLKEALMAQKRAEDDSEIEKFRALETEQAGIEEAHKKERVWQKEIEDVRNQHTLDMAALLSTTEELQKVKQELAKISDAKNQALIHADDATKIAEIHAEKVKFLSSEVTRLKSLLDKLNLERENNENKTVSMLNEEIDSLTKELKNAKSFEDKLVEREAMIDSLTRELKNTNSFEDKLVEKDAMIDSLTRELKNAKCFEDKLVETKAVIDSLTKELKNAKSFEDKLKEREAMIEQLNVDVEAAKLAESYARNLLKEWKIKVENLENRAEVASQLERSATDSMVSLEKEIVEKNGLLEETENEICELQEKVGLLEITIRRQKGDLDESQRLLGKAKDDTFKMEKTVESLKSELEMVEDEKTLALNNEKLAASSVQNLLEEKNKLINELESSKDEEEKSKKAMESLAAALHEVSSEARQAKEDLLSNQADHESYDTQIEVLKSVLKATNEKYETMLENEKHEIQTLKGEIEQSKNGFQKLKTEWEQKEAHLASCVTETNEENAAKEKEISRLINLLKETEEDANALKEEGDMLKYNLKDAESEVTYLKQLLGEAKAESMKLKESLLDKENELQSVIEENEDVQRREAASNKKIIELSKLIEEEVTAKKQLSKLLEEVTAKKQVEENGELTDSEKDYDLLPKVVEFSEQNGHVTKMELPSAEGNLIQTTNPDHFENGIKKQENVESKEKEEVAEGESKMWESCKIEEKDYSPEREEESLEENEDAKTEAMSESFDEINSPSENLDNVGNLPVNPKQQKKKKPLLHKFGSLLKKKSPSSK